MSACCVFGCKNRHSSSSKLMFYRIPSARGPFLANRRRLWLQAIEKVNGSIEKLKGSARICGAHFISGEASLDFDNPDFVPSVFTCAKQSPSPKKKRKWIYGRRKRRRLRANVKEQENTTPSRVDSPVDVQSSVLMEETQTPSPSVPKEEETLTKGDETETETLKSQTTSSPNKASPSFKVPSDILKLGKMIPTVLLKQVFAPDSGYQCELCNQNFDKASQLVKHRQLHEEENPFICEICGQVFTTQADFTEHHHVQEPSFPCNMCDRSFTTSHNLKRHKLLHVKDGRKCSKCGVLFCKLHNHVVFLPQTELEQESSINETLQENPEPHQSSDLDDDAQSIMTVTPLQTTASPAPPNPVPLSKTHNALPPASHTIISEIPVPELVKPFSVPCPCPPVPKFQQHQEVPPSLNIFSPQYLTSALLEVKRNYEYILSEPRAVENKKNTVKEEPCELPQILPHEQSVVEQDKKERIAYDLEIVL